MNSKQQEFLGEAQQYLKQLAAQLGVVADISVDERGLRCRLEKDEAEAQKQFEAYSWKFGYPKSWFGKVFTAHDGKAYKIVGCKPTAEKNCLVIRRVLDGREFVCSPGFTGLPKDMAA